MNFQMLTTMWLATITERNNVFLVQRKCGDTLISKHGNTKINSKIIFRKERDSNYET